LAKSIFGIGSSILLRDKKINQINTKDLFSNQPDQILQQIFFYLNLPEKRSMQIVNKKGKEIATKHITEEEKQADNLVKFFAKHYQHFFCGTYSPNGTNGTFYLDKKGNLMGVSAPDRFYFSWDEVTKKLKHERVSPKNTSFFNFYLRFKWSPTDSKNAFVLGEMCSQNEEFLQNRIRDLFIELLNQKALIGWNKNPTTLKTQTFNITGPKWLAYCVDSSFDK
jgi:hypothetical protein